MRFSKTPKTIVVKEGQPNIDISMELKYSGFGDVNVGISSTFQGQLISQGDSIVYELMRRLWEDKDGQVKLPGKGDVDPTMVGAISRQIIERIQAGNISTDEVNIEAIKYLKEWLAELGPDKIRQVLEARVEDLLVGLMFDLVSRNPISGVRLDEPRTKLVTRIRFPVSNLRLNLRYRDLAGNRYSASPIDISIEYKEAKEKPMLVEMPVTISSWQRDPIMNVGQWSE